MKRQEVFALSLIVVLVLACAGTPTATPTFNQPIQQSTATQVLPTDTTVPTETLPPTLTYTPKSTNTPRSTSTPVPTKTPEPTRVPVTLSGTGDSVVDSSWGDYPGLLHITYTGGGNFAVWNYDANGERIDLLVNTIGNYSGTIPLDFNDDDTTSRFQIESSGNWTIEIVDLTMVRREDIPGTFTGIGDDVVYFRGGTPDLMIASATGHGNFAIWSYGDSGRDLLVNDIAPYDGTVVVPKDTVLLVITAGSNWSIEIKTR